MTDGWDVSGRRRTALRPAANEASRKRKRLQSTTKKLVAETALLRSRIFCVVSFLAAELFSAKKSALRTIGKKSLEEMPNRDFRPRPIGRRLASQTLSSPKAFLLCSPPTQAIPAHTTRFRHLRLKSRWPPSSRSSSPPGACRSAMPHLRVRAAARRARRSHGQAPVPFVTDARARPSRPPRGGRTRLGHFPPFRCGARPHRSSIRARPGRPDGSRFTDDPRLTDHALSIRVFFR